MKGAYLGFLPVGEGIVGRVAASGEAETTDETLCVPASDSRGKVFAVIELKNKAGGGPFVTDDEKRLKEFSRSLSYILESWCKMGCTCRRAEAIAKSCVIPPGEAMCHPARLPV